MATHAMLLVLLVAVGAAAGYDGSELLDDRGISGRVEASQGFMDLMSKNGCGRFAGLVDATANSTAIFRESLVHAGLSIFCPDDQAVAAFEPAFNNLTADGRLAVVLYHAVGSGPGSFKDLSKASVCVQVDTLATVVDEASSPQRYKLIICNGAVLSPWPPSPAAARVAMTVVEEAPLAVYVIDAVMLPRDEAACTPSC